MDVVYINELLEKRISHGMNYFGKDKKLKSFKKKFRKKKIYVRNKHWKIPENVFRNFFFQQKQPNTVKYFPKIIFRKIFYGKINRP